MSVSCCVPVSIKLIGQTRVWTVFMSYAVDWWLGCETKSASSQNWPIERGDEKVIFFWREGDRQVEMNHREKRERQREREREREREAMAIAFLMCEQTPRPFHQTSLFSVPRVRLFVLARSRNHIGSFTNEKHPSDHLSGLDQRRVSRSTSQRCPQCWFKWSIFLFVNNTNGD